MFELFQKISLFILINSALVFSQSFGFGCFGFVGGFAGYGYQNYESGYLNNQINGFNTAMSDGTNNIIPEFNTAKGYRIGLNFFRANFSGFFFSLKGYYEFISEDHSYSYTNLNSTTNSELELDLKSWNIGIDFGIPITNFLSWKIVDGALNFNSARLIHKPNLEDNTHDVKYNNDSPELGYNISTGFILSVIEDFVSIEGSAGYRFLEIKTVTAEDGSVFLLRPENSRQVNEEEFITGGGFNAFLQINIGFPL